MSKVGEKLKAVAAAVAAIEKQFGKGAVMNLGAGTAEKISVIPSEFSQALGNVAKSFGGPPPPPPRQP